MNLTKRQLYFKHKEDLILANELFWDKHREFESIVIKNSMKEDNYYIKSLWKRLWYNRNIKREEKEFKIMIDRLLEEYDIDLEFYDWKNGEPVFQDKLRSSLLGTKRSP